jgi:hypothetical protein
MVLISFSTSGASPAQVTALYSSDDDDDDEWLNVEQPVKANANAQANNELHNLLFIAVTFTHSQHCRKCESVNF